MKTVSGVKQLSFTPSIFKKITPEQYLSHLLNQDVRSDGRSVSEFREIVINDNCISTANGSAIIRAGENVFVCGIKAEIAEPFENSPNEGWIVPNLELSPLCSSKFKPGPPSDLAQVVSQELHQTLQQSNLINLQSLCIFEKKAAWVLYADIICLNYDGSAFDYAWAALFAALKTVKLPTAVWDEDLERVICASTLTRPVQLSTEVRSFSWSVFDDKLLADPTDEEEDLSTEFLTIMLNSSKNIVKIIKLGGTHIQPLLLKKCIEVARSKF
ncbi:Exosome complex component rrp43 [Schizosaccharomyces pombe]|uniref:Exosome complex component rrp43 n=1 Tax=Schizosaccharomyces pombe (strain 972 / ATCC 24843) TaxID=284812 RepID=RRP43_SCHPO|nr:putative exosome subunit Rrp43 [Schizosaccharomyces pombe]Q10205.1 RecName: Full=Exosome complex component rrp43; AltName: Full=Ribosomal RNA-processing protein 43 [Schizosaccharomyces pombe 972h-]CAA20427.1 exosome subunit Rrp43 (predicted) [Schizosaccharomyces pombe]|eukprot:NP_596385.1 putative exosome subunit Rrp43 [Schizosaccharomyces pombe]